jgi:hypothetical protein
LPALIASGRVELLGVVQQVGNVVEAGEMGIPVRLRILDETPRIGDLHTHLGLPLLQNLDGHGVSHVGVQQLRLVAFELSEASPLVSDESAARFGGLTKLVACAAAEGSDLLLGEPAGFASRKVGSRIQCGCGPSCTSRSIAIASRHSTKSSR